MIRELKLASHNLSDEQKVEDVIRSLHTSWEYMKIRIIHNENKSFEDIEHYLVVEDDRRDTSKAIDHAILAELVGIFNPKQKKQEQKNMEEKDI